MSCRPCGGATTYAVAPLAYLAGMGVSAYWRRRFIVLAVGLAAFALAAWVLSSMLAVDAGRLGTTRLLRSGHQPTSASMPASSPFSPSPTATGQPSGQGTIGPDWCVRSDIVLSLSTGQTQSGAGWSPVFDVGVVSTQSAECSFNVDSRHLALEVRQGPVRIWSSADCAVGTGGPVVMLRRGVPTVVAISWSGRSSAPGCSGRTTRVSAGTYTAYAVDGALSSAPVSFRLR